MNDDFDERSGIVHCDTEFGRWWQTIDEVVIEINVPKGTKGREVKCDFKVHTIKIEVREEVLLQGELFNMIHPAETIWTLEDHKVLQICLIKTDKKAANCWRSLLKDKYETDPSTFDRMEKKLTLQRFQLENPGMDFSSADISGGYHGGGPDMPAQSFKQ